MTERWLPVKGWPAYEVSDFGRVRSIDRYVPNGHGHTYLVAGKVLTPRRNEHGYQVVTLRGGKTTHKTPLVHRLVAEAFVSNSSGKPCVNHLDCDPANNRAENLEWCTQAENLAYMHRLGRGKGPTGQRPPIAKLTDDQVRLIRATYALGGISHQQIADRFNISKRSIGRILLKKGYANVQ